MRYREFATTLKEDAIGAVKAAAPTAISMIAPEFLKKYPNLAKIASLSPYAAQIVGQLASGQVSAAALTALQNLAPEAGVLPKDISNLISHWSNTSTVQSVAGNVAGDALAGAATLPIALSMPYVMAGEERKKIDADPWNKKYDNNPYAMSVRSAGKITQGQAGVQNQRNVVKTSSTAGNPMPGTPEFEKLQQQYAK